MTRSAEAILISGGIDSAALAYLRKPQYGFVVDYGQLAAEAEIVAAQEICSRLGIELDVIRADCRQCGSGSMLGQKSLECSPSAEWWPYRNQLLATLVAPSALRKGIHTLVFASVNTDGFHIDGRADFFAALDRLISMQEGRVRVIAPAIHLTSVELVKEAGIPENLLAWTHSCHAGSFACGKCPSCDKHIGVLRDCGINV